MFIRPSLNRFHRCQSGKVTVTAPIRENGQNGNKGTDWKPVLGNNTSLERRKELHIWTLCVLTLMTSGLGKFFNFILCFTSHLAWNFGLRFHTTVGTAERSVSVKLHPEQIPFQQSLNALNAQDQVWFGFSCPSLQGICGSLTDHQSLKTWLMSFKSLN